MDTEGRPVIINDTGSAEDIAFAAKHSGIVLITRPSGNQMSHATESLPSHLDGGWRSLVFVDPPEMMRVSRCISSKYLSW
jgi:hypothetical protein